MKHIPAAEQAFEPTGLDGIERALFRQGDTDGRSSLVRLRAGSRFPLHRHEASEDVLVLSGRVRIDEFTLASGDYLLTEAGEVHGVEALEDSLIFVASRGPTPFIDP